MKLGICGAPAQLCTARALGYDYFETSAVGIAAMTPSEFAAFAEQNRVLRSGRFAGCLVCNGLFPGGLALVGPAADEQKIAAYLSGLLPRLRQLGVRKVVFGSGSARGVIPFARREIIFAFCAAIRYNSCIQAASQPQVLGKQESS